MTIPYFDLTGKVALITGGSKGLGEQMAYGLAEVGADLALISRTQADLDRVAAEIHQASGRRVIGVAADVTREADIERMVGQVMAEYGRIDILINNAGMGGTTPIRDLAEEEWDSYMSLNLKGPVFCAKHVGAEMAKRKKGHNHQRLLAVLADCGPLYGGLRGDQGRPGPFHADPGPGVGPRQHPGQRPVPGLF